MAGVNSRGWWVPRGGARGQKPVTKSVDSKAKSVDFEAEAIDSVAKAADSVTETAHPVAKTDCFAPIPIDFGVETACCASIPIDFLPQPIDFV